MVMPSELVYSKNRFAAIFSEEEESFTESVTSDYKSNIIPSNIIKKNNPSPGPILTGSSLSKVDALLKYREAEKKRLIEEAEARKRALEEASKLAAEEAERKKVEAAAKRAEAKEKKTTAKVDDGFITVGKDFRKQTTRFANIPHRKPEKIDEVSEVTPRQVRRSHDREDRSGKKFSSKKGYAGHKEPTESIVEEVNEVVSLTEEPSAPVTKSSNENDKLVEKESSIPKKSIMTFDEYLSTKNDFILDLPKRPANEGCGPNQFEKSTPLVRMSESFMGFSINDSAFHTTKPTLVSPTSTSHGGSFVVDPRLEAVFSKPILGTSKPSNGKPFSSKKTSAK